MQAIGIYLWVCFVFTFAALIEFSAAAYLEKRKNFLQSKLQSPHQLEVAETDTNLKEETNLRMPMMGKKRDRGDTLDIVDERVRKNSYISRRMNDPKLMEVYYS